MPFDLPRSELPLRVLYKCFIIAPEEEYKIPSLVRKLYPPVVALPSNTEPWWQPQLEQISVVEPPLRLDDYIFILQLHCCEFGEDEIDGIQSRSSAALLCSFVMPTAHVDNDAMSDAVLEATATSQSPWELPFGCNWAEIDEDWTINAQVYVLRRDEKEHTRLLSKSAQNAYVLCEGLGAVTGFEWLDFETGLKEKRLYEPAWNVMFDSNFAAARDVFCKISVGFESQSYFSCTRVFCREDTVTFQNAKIEFLSLGPQGVDEYPITRLELRQNLAELQFESVGHIER